LKLENRFKYNGKELNHQEFSDGNGLDWYSYGDREFDPQLGTFHAVDPYADNAFESSPYGYALNNPVSLIDINGDSTVPKNDVNWGSFDTQNNTVGLDEVDVFGGFDFSSLLYGGNGPLYTGALVQPTNFIKETTKTAIFRPNKNWQEPLGKTNTIVGLGASALEIGGIGITVGNNFKFYRTGWHGNQYVSTIGLSKIGRIAGWATFGLGTALDAYGLRNYYVYGPNSENAVSPKKAGTNLGFGIYGLFGGLPGAAVSGVYFGIDVTIGWPNAVQSMMEINRTEQYMIQQKIINYSDLKN